MGLSAGSGREGPVVVATLLSAQGPSSPLCAPGVLAVLVWSLPGKGWEHTAQGFSFGSLPTF